MKRVDSALQIQASDDVMVTRVSVTIFDNDGVVLEKGEATQEAASEWWRYIPQHAGKVMVEARDLAGNVAREESRDW